MSKLINERKSTKYDLEERTALLAEKTIELLKKVTVTTITRPIIEQNTKAVCSIAANYCEANEAGSKRDFIHKMVICKKEIKETMLWFRLLGNSDTMYSNEFRLLWKEAHELLLIFSSIISSTKNNSHKK